jgi:hypothetical protein
MGRVSGAEGGWAFASKRGVPFSVAPVSPVISICVDPGRELNLVCSILAWRAQHGGLGRVLINIQPSADLDAPPNQAVILSVMQQDSRSIERAMHALICVTLRDY